MLLWILGLIGLCAINGALCGLVAKKGPIASMLAMVWCVGSGWLYGWFLFPKVWG